VLEGYCVYLLYIDSRDRLKYILFWY